MSSTITPGLLILHGNQMEMLRAAVFDWLRRHPLGPLEQETILVQSNGFAEWLKIALAEELGVCAATRVALPARFLWEAYRAMLGRERVPSRSPFDRDPLTWRLMRLLPTLLKEPVFAPLTHFLGDGCPERRLQLAERLADLFDQYQVYRADWLTDWEIGRDQLRRAGGEPVPLGPDQLWQARLWRAVHESVPPMQRGSGRAAIHEVFVAKIGAGEPPTNRLPRRVVLFGMSALPYQTLQAIAALSRHTQVLLAVPNPCQFYWGDIIEGRELLKAAHKRQPARGGVDLATLPIEELHAHSHPLLASWGRQGRDFVRMLDEFDNEEGRPETEGITKLRIDLFSDGDGDTLLQQVQAAVRDMRPLSEHPHVPPAPEDRSIEFHITHSTQREVEALHDQLLAMFAQDPTLRPRDIVVMVPDIDTFSAAIHAVFDQHKKSDPRHIPFEIGDTRDRSVNPLLVALEWLLRLPQQRCRQSEIRDLLDVPAVAARFGLAGEDLHTLGTWIDGAGVRWGLDGAHRAGLGLGAAGEQNAWIFGVRRMLLGYASGAGARFGDIEPYAEVGGLDAALAGSLAQFVDCLLEWRARLAETRAPAEWVVQARALLAAFFDGREEGDRITLAQLGEALNCWLEMTEGGGFDEPVPLSVLREAWLGQIDQPTLNHQFVSGGVTFCTLMPMRAVPFRAVCLLGMNDGDFPRRTPQNDFDLLSLPGMSRPGDRSRRDDDRYLMLEALLAARDKLYISWVGRNVRDNSEQPASVLVAQLRDYLHAGWNLDLASLTTEHALQPFSRRYFEEGGLLTYAREWRSAHNVDSEGPQDALPPYELEPDFRLKLSELGAFLKQPAKQFFRRRLGVIFNAEKVVGEDEEPFALDALDRYFLEDVLLDDAGKAEALDEVRQNLDARAERLTREGMLPIGLMGHHWKQQLVEGLVPVRSAWLALGARFPDAAPKLALSLDLNGVLLEDWIDRLRTDGRQTAWLMQVSSKVLDKKGAVRGEKLIDAWLRQLAAGAAEGPTEGITGYLVARDALVTMAPIEREEALSVLGYIAGLWQRNLDAPLPVACRTALAQLAGRDARTVYEGDGQDVPGEVEREPCLARLWPQFGQLAASGDWPELAEALYGGLAHWMAEQIEVTPHAGDAQ